MMRPTLLAALVLWTLLGTSIHHTAAQGAPADGNRWIAESLAVREALTAGFLYGMQLGRDFAFWGMPGLETPTERSTCVDAALTSYRTVSDKYLAEPVTVSQIRLGIDDFYKDYRNRSLALDRAVWLVLNGIAGTREAEIQKMIETHRRNATGP